MRLHYVGPAVIFQDEAGNNVIMTMEQAKQQADAITQDLTKKGIKSRVEIINAETKAKELEQKARELL